MTSLVLLWILKSTKASLIFPLMVLALVGFRKLMDYVPNVFSQNDLYWLDSLMPDSKQKQAQKKKKKRRGCLGCGKKRKLEITEVIGTTTDDDTAKPMMTPAITITNNQVV